MAKPMQPPPPPLSHVKPTARKRTALTRESAIRATKSAQFKAAASAVLSTDNPGLLQPENELEQTLSIRQQHLMPHLDRATVAKASFRLDLEQSGLAPYNTAVFSRSSRSLLVASRKGHIAVTQWRRAALSCELYLNETVRDATFLHDDALFAVAQKEAAYIYDASGAQVHVLRTHRQPGTIISLPHHLLLATTSATIAPHPRLVYTDTTVGDVIADHNYASRHLRLGACTQAANNPANGVLHLAHVSGVVSLWSPIMSAPLARVLTHAGAVRHVAVAHDGRWMVTTGSDANVHVWDLRTYKRIGGWRTPALASAVAVSQRGLVAVSFGASVHVWAPGGGTSVAARSVDWGEKPYMMETFSGCGVTGLEFCGLEDVLAVCHEDGVRTMIVPGAGEATFDSRAPNPYETRKQRRENEVGTLLDRLPAASIVLDTTFVGSVEKEVHVRQDEMRQRQRAANEEKSKNKKAKKKAKGRNKISKRLKRKQANVIDERRLRLEEEVEQKRKQHEAMEKLKKRDREHRQQGTSTGALQDPLPAALQRFVRKKQ